MATNRLSDKTIGALKVGSKVGLYGDGGNLYLRLTKTGSKIWLFRWKSRGKVRQLALGFYPARSLTQAREKARQMQSAIANGRDPADVLKPPADAQTLRAYSVGFFERKREAFSNGKHAAQYERTLEKWVFPHIGDKLAREITYGDVETTLYRPQLAKLKETQKRVRQRLASLLYYAARCEGELHRFNPANAEAVDLPKRKRSDVKNLPAAPWQDVPAIIAGLRQREATSAALLRFSILTCARSGEARGAMFAELDLEAGLWTLPPERMKARVEHRVPLNPEAIEVLKAMADRRVEGQELVFPGAVGTRISDVAVNKQLRLVYSGSATAHGFRTSFRTWAEHQTSFSRRAVELCLAHTNSNKIEGAYLRDDLLDLRRGIMAAWGGYLAGKANVVELVPNFNTKGWGE